MTLNDDFLQKMKEKLVSQRLELLRALDDKNIHIDTDGDECDEIQGNILIEMNNQMNTRNNHKLNLIENSIRQIEENTYGICQDCEECIPEKRLLINPYAETCVSCAEEREIEEKQRKREQY